MLKAILCQGLYPQLAVADAGNAGRASNEQQYVTRPSGGLFMSPSSVLTCQDFAVAGVGRGGGGRLGSRSLATHGGHGVASRGPAADAGRGDGLLCYGQLVETQRPFVSSVTPLPALQALLLFSARVDTSEDASLVRLGVSRCLRGSSVDWCFVLLNGPCAPAVAAALFFFCHVVCFFVFASFFKRRVA